MSEKDKRAKQFLGLVAGLNAPAPQIAPAPTTTKPRKLKTAPATKPKDEAKAESGEPAEIEEKIEAEEKIKATVYIPKSLHRRVRVALADRDERLTLTDLLVDLLKDWADGQGSER